MCRPPRFDNIRDWLHADLGNPMALVGAEAWGRDFGGPGLVVGTLCLGTGGGVCVKLLSSRMQLIDSPITYE